MVAISAGLCLFHHCPFYGIGVGTVLSALLLGRVIKLFAPAVRRIKTPPAHIIP